MAGYGPIETTLGHDISADSETGPKNEFPMDLRQ